MIVESYALDNGDYLLIEQEEIPEELPEELRSGLEENEPWKTLEFSPDNPPRIGLDEDEAREAIENQGYYLSGGIEVEFEEEVI